jgi:large subunit ribosomal protein L29e
MAKSKNHTCHNQTRKAHRNGEDGSAARRKSAARVQSGFQRNVGDLILLPCRSLARGRTLSSRAASAFGLPGTWFRPCHRAAAACACLGDARHRRVGAGARAHHSPTRRGDRVSCDAAARRGAACDIRPLFRVRACADASTARRGGAGGRTGARASDARKLCERLHGSTVGKGGPTCSLPCSLRPLAVAVDEGTPSARTPPAHAGHQPRPRLLSLTAGGTHAQLHGHARLLTVSSPSPPPLPPPFSRAGIKRPKQQRYRSTRGVDPKYLRNARYALKGTLLARAESQAK